MSGISKKLISAAGAGVAGGLAIEDVFSTYLYTGNGSTQTITNGIDLAGEGGLTWIKSRSSATDHQLFDTERGATKELISNSTAVEATDADTLTAFNADGFSLGADSNTNTSSATYASWTFRKAPRFFDVVTYTGTGSARTVDHNLGTTVGSIIIKRTDTTSNWAVYHRGNTAAPETDYLLLNGTNATADDATYWNDTEPTDSVFTVGTNAAVNASGGTYVAYLFAHDPLGPSEDGSDGLIACGGFTTDGSGRATIDLGWEPQFVIWKPVSTTGSWEINDQMRGWNEVEGKYLIPNTSGAEGTRNNVSTPWKPTATGIVFDFSVLGGALANTSYIYIAIRRGPMRVPESGTEVFAVDNRGGTIPAFISDFPVDMSIFKATVGTNTAVSSRLTGTGELTANTTNAETSQTYVKFDYMDGWNSLTGASTVSYSWMFRRAPGFFDVVAYTGDGVAGRTVPHNLGVAPELMIVKRRNTSGTNWIVYHEDLASGDAVLLNLTNAAFAFGAGGFGDGSSVIPPTSDNFTVGSTPSLNGSGDTYIAYLFATLPGVSKVGSYTGNGTSQTINCGFTSGARFILIKRTDSTGDWYVWDTARGIVTGNDPHLSLNTTAAEVTSDDSIDPASSGFIVNQVAATNINVSSASYIFLAIA